MRGHFGKSTNWQCPGTLHAIPDIGENQQIVFTDWPGRSPQDVEDQVTYPLTVTLQGIPGVKTVRSFSMFGLGSHSVQTRKMAVRRSACFMGPS